LRAQPEEKYIVLLIRPNSLPVYRFVRKMLGRRDIDIGFDVLASNAKLDWEGEMQKLRITIDE
jgi:arabinogalactan endo-1,4-beta-galactosidase